MTMRTGVPLATLRNEVMIEAGLSTQPGHNTASVERINHLLNRTERMMAIEDTWPTQNLERFVTVPGDTQYVDLPNDMSFTMIDSIHVSYGDEWLPISYSIGARERTIYKDTQRSMPIRRYEYSAERSNQIEVWPIGSDTQELYLQGSRKIGSMDNDLDGCSLDGDVLVYRVAAQMIGRDNQADAEILLGYAQTRTQKLLKRGGAMKRKPINLAGKEQSYLRPGIDYIAPGST